MTRWCRWRLCSQPRCSGDGLEDLGSSAPALLGCLREIAVGEFLSSLRQEMLAGLSILLGGHLGSCCCFWRLATAACLGNDAGAAFMMMFESE